jgi:hypothetical protein
MCWQLLATACLGECDIIDCQPSAARLSYLHSALPLPRPGHPNEVRQYSSVHTANALLPHRRYQSSALLPSPSRPCRRRHSSRQSISPPSSAEFASGVPPLARVIVGLRPVQTPKTAAVFLLFSIGGLSVLAELSWLISWQFVAFWCDTLTYKRSRFSESLLAAWTH